MTKVLTGKITSTKMAKTVVVEVKRAYSHPMYKKIIRSHKKYKAHVEDDMKLTVGDLVDIGETRPISKQKKFKVIKKY